MRLADLRWTLRCALLATVVVILQACGGGGGCGGQPTGTASPVGCGGSSTTTTSTQPAPVIELPPISSTLELGNQCSALNTRAPENQRTTSLSVEKAWIRALFDEYYLWYGEVPAVNGDDWAYVKNTVSESLGLYFNALRTPALTASGKRKDQFSFMTPTTTWSDRITLGVNLGYGIEWKFANSRPPRRIRVVWVEPGSPAAAAGVMRGDALVSVDGVSSEDSTQAGVDVLNAAMFPSEAGQAHSFVFNRNGASRSLSLTPASVTSDPVPIVKTLDVNGEAVGYLMYQSFNAVSEAKLIRAVEQLQASQVKDLVLDLRYNGGGYLYVANTLAAMLSNAATTEGKTFERLKFNDKRLFENASGNTLFTNMSCILVNGSCSARTPLPRLGLDRVYVLTGPGTCSASESVVNALRGVGLNVHLVGDTTCGKPYGFTEHRNCGYSYFPIEFQGVNHQGFGDYADGFAPTCAAQDDLGQVLGESSENLLASALYHRRTGLCLGADGSIASLRNQPEPSYGAELSPPPAWTSKFQRPLR